MGGQDAAGADDGAGSDHDVRPDGDIRGDVGRRVDHGCRVHARGRHVRRRGEAPQELGDGAFDVEDANKRGAVADPGVVGDNPRLIGDNDGSGLTVGESIETFSVGGEGQRVRLGRVERRQGPDRGRWVAFHTAADPLGDLTNGCPFRIHHWNCPS